MVLFNRKKENVENKRENQKLQSLQEQYGEIVKLLLKEKTRKHGYTIMEEIEEKGLAEAGVVLGQYFAAQENSKKAMQHYKIAARASIAEGYWGLSSLENHSYLPDIKSDWVNYVVKSAELGSVDGMNEAGNIYNRLNKFELSMYWFKLALLAQKQDAIISVNGICKKWYEAGRPEENINDTKHKIGLATLKAYSRHAVDDEYIEELMGIDDSYAELIAGDCLESANALESAFNMYTWSASQKNSIAMNRAANMLISGHGVTRDTERAIEYFQEAAELENVPSMFVMGEYFRNGKNSNLAMYWYNKAYCRGYEPAGTRMQQMIDTQR